MNGLETVLGLEVHVQLRTVSKMFWRTKQEQKRAPPGRINNCKTRLPYILSGAGTPTIFIPDRSTPSNARHKVVLAAESAASSLTIL